MQYLNQTLRFQEGTQLEHAPAEALVAPITLGDSSEAGEQIAILVDLSPASTHRSRELRALVLNTYMASTGSAVARLRRALAAANRHLMRSNDQAAAGSKSTGSITCVVFAADEVFVGQVGSSCTLVVHADPALYPAGVDYAMESFPQDRQRTPVPLGVTAAPDIRIAYTVIGDRSTLLLATSSAAEMLPHDQWQETLWIPLMEDVIARIRRAAAASQASGSLVLIRSIDTTEAPLEAATPEAKPRRRLFGQRKVRPATTARAVPDAVAEHSTGRQALTLKARPDAAPVASHHVTKITTGDHGAHPHQERPTFPEAIAAAHGGLPTEDENITVPEGPLPSVVTVSRQTAERPLPRKERKRSSLSLAGIGERWARLKRAYKARRYKGRATSAERAHLREAMRTLLPTATGPVPQTPQRKAPRERTPLMSGLALGLILVVFIITSTVYLQVGQPAKAKELLEEARTLRSEAYTTQKVETWRQLQDITGRILALDATNTEAVQWRGEAEQALSQLSGIRILDVRQLLDLSTAPTPRRMLATGAWIYLLNTTTDEVVGLLLNGDRLSTSADAPTPIMRQGQTLNGEPIEHLVDLAWIPASGNYPDGALLIYSDGGTLYIYEPGLAPGTTARQRISGNLEPGAVSLIETFGERIYLVQRRDNQILVYDAVNGIYESPRGYFPESVERDLSLVLDIAIDGRIYLLTGDGAIQSFLTGTEDPFTIGEVPDTPLQPIAFAVDPDADAGFLYLGDARNRQIVVLDKSGTVKYRYRAPGDELLHLEALAIGENPHVLYFVAGNRLYAAPLPALPER